MNLVEEITCRDILLALELSFGTLLLSFILKKMYKTEYYRSVLDVDITFDKDKMRSYRKKLRPEVAEKSKPRTNRNRKHLLIDLSELSRNLELEITERESEVNEFRIKTQNAIVSPLLTQALVKRTERILDAIHSVTPPSQPRGIERFRKIAKTVIILCAISCRWKRYDSDLLRKIGGNSKIGNDTGKSVVHFDTKTFASFQSKLNEEVRQCLMMIPSQRGKLEEKKVASLLKKYRVFKMFPEEKETFLYTHIGYEKYDRGRVICLQNRPTERFYFVISGLISKVQTVQLAKGIKKQLFGDLHQGSSTPIQDILQGSVRTNSFICKTDVVEVLIIDRSDMQIIFCDTISEASLKATMKAINLFNTYPVKELIENNALSVQFYTKDAAIEQNINDSQYIYIVKTGFCRVLLKREDVFQAKPKQSGPFVTQDFGKATSRQKKLPRLIQKGINGDDFIQINTIEKGGIYGLDSLLPRALNMVKSAINDRVYDDIRFQKQQQTILVSGGAECLLVSKAKFLKHTDFCTLSKLISTHIEETVSADRTAGDPVKWKSYKENIVKEIVNKSRKVK